MAIDWMKELGWHEGHIEEFRHAGFSYIRQGKYDIALPFFETLCVLQIDDPYDFQTLGAIYLQLGKPAKAITFLDQALKLDADHGPTLLNLTKALFMLGKIDEGLKLAEILQNEPDGMVANPAKALILAHS